MLFLWIPDPFTVWESIINKPKKADPEKAIQRNLLNPLKGACVSFNNFSRNLGSIFDINDLKHRLKSIWKIQILIIQIWLRRDETVLLAVEDFLLNQLSTF